MVASEEFSSALQPPPMTQHTVDLWGSNLSLHQNHWRVSSAGITGPIPRGSASVDLGGIGRPDLFPGETSGSGTRRPGTTGLLLLLGFFSQPILPTPLSKLIIV
jgi:hypothetical protein